VQLVGFGEHVDVIGLRDLVDGRVTRNSGDFLGQLAFGVFCGAEAVSGSLLAIA
jgi:hypothetical protein